VLLLIKGTFEVAHQKANKALETSDLSTTDAEAVDGGGECRRAHTTPARYSPSPETSSKKHASSALSSLQPPAAPPSLLVESAALVQPSTASAGPPSKRLHLPSCCHSQTTFPACIVPVCSL